MIDESIGMKRYNKFNPEYGVNHYVSWFLMASYMYYHRSINIMEDKEFDELCIGLKGRWVEVDHPHKHLICHDNLVAGTGFNITSYPKVLIYAAVDVAEERGLL